MYFCLPFSGYFFRNFKRITFTRGKKYHCQCVLYWLRWWLKTFAVNFLLFLEINIEINIEINKSTNQLRLDFFVKKKMGKKQIISRLIPASSLKPDHWTTKTKVSEKLFYKIPFNPLSFSCMSLPPHRGCLWFLTANVHDLYGSWY